jgi:pimeloyl-ACP methyl ester carboxylesterase
VPDFLGFGSSEEILHPYYVEEWTATSVIDLVRASKEFALMEGLEPGDELFLAGYSEGGYATMAAHKYIQENPGTGLNVTASGPASGGYDLNHMRNYFFSVDEYSEPYYLGYVILAYLQETESVQPLSDYFKEPYASRLPDLFDGSKSGGQINAALTSEIEDLISDELLESFDTSDKFADFRRHLNENSLTDWYPTAPMRLYHGTADVTVPYENTVITYNQLLEKQGEKSNVSLFPIEGGTHGTGFLPYAESVISWILSF